MKSKLHFLFEEASDKISASRYPNHHEFESMIRQVIEAMGDGPMGEDLKIIDAHIDGDTFCVITVEKVGTWQVEEYEIPADVINADDPIKAAKVNYLKYLESVQEYALAKANREAGEARVHLARFRKELEIAKGEFNRDPIGAVVPNR